MSCSGKKKKSSTFVNASTCSRRKESERGRTKHRKGSDGLVILIGGQREEDNGRNTRGEIIRLLEVSPGDSGGHSVSIDRVGVADGPANRGHSRIRWVCHGGRSQFVVTGDQHVFFELLILRPYLPT